LCDFNELEYFLWTDFRQKMESYENLCSGNAVVPCGQAGGRTDVHEEAKIRFSQFCEHAKKKRFGSAISVIGFRRSCSYVIGLRRAVVLSRLQRGVWGPFCNKERTTDNVILPLLEHRQQRENKYYSFRKMTK